MIKADEMLKDLIKKMLVVNVNERIKIEEILNHPWVVKSATTPIKNNLCVIDQTVVVPSLIEKMVEMGYNEIEITKSLSRKVKNEVTTTYYLLYIQYKESEKSKSIGSRNMIYY